ncbi:S26 family signal peptidase [Actinoplanes lobatus]|nr:signal peptidase I [Actinoplanes lobatus]GGN75983.1 S26 family signal peptidase [Actinoplanes lobatus]GIE38471.1 S26 family signal peptidase [Actinoplanes lobatus]
MVFALALTAAVLLAAVLAARRFLVVTVEGISMTPTLRPGDRLLARRISGAAVERGAIVVMRPDGHPGYYLKRVAAVAGDPVPEGIPADAATVPPRTVVLRGDNAHHSLDSRVWGCVPVERIVAVTVRPIDR